MNILINALGITDSGGVTVLKKLFEELSKEHSNKYVILCNKNQSVIKLIINYKLQMNFEFKVIKDLGIFKRVYYENFIFKEIIKDSSIDLIYNFSGSSQFFIKTPQLVKTHNLLFYTKKLDRFYQSRLILWIRHVFLKRIFFKFMLNRSRHIEIQSPHVKSCLSDFIKMKDKVFYIKSDIDISDSFFLTPKQYDFNKKINFLYIIGPHFEYPHKNIKDFTNAMLGMKNSNINYEITITLSEEQLSASTCWDCSLNTETNFLGYIDSREELKNLFCDNTILISTSVIETLGLHVVEAIQNGILTIVPGEEYASSVYGNKMFKYDLFNKDSLISVIMNILNYKNSFEMKILDIQEDLRKSEMTKFRSILDIFDEVINVQK